ncbi:MAG: hypothetical protein AAGA03_19165, partial [Planctomycetota bacterium]
MIGALLCGVQVTVLLGLALLLSNLTLGRHPRLSSWLGGLGMAGAAAVVLLALADVPRPWNLRRLEAFSVDNEASLLNPTNESPDSLAGSSPD